MQTTRFLFSARRFSLTYGQLPSRAVFEECFDGDVGPDRLYQVRGCSRVGAQDYTCAQLWAELVKAVDDWSGANLDQGPEDHTSQDEYDAANLAGQWAADVLSTFGIEWV